MIFCIIFWYLNTCALNTTLRYYVAFFSSLSLFCKDISVSGMMFICVPCIVWTTWYIFMKLGMCIMLLEVTHLCSIIFCYHLYWGESAPLTGVILVGWNIFSIQFDSDKQWTIVVRHLKFCMETTMIESVLVEILHTSGILNNVIITL